MRRAIVCVWLAVGVSCGPVLIACREGSVNKKVVVIPFDEISPGGVAKIEDTCREIKAALHGTQTPHVCLEVAVSSRVMTELCGRIDAGWDACLPLLRFRGGRATVDTPGVVYVITQLEHVYP